MPSKIPMPAIEAWGPLLALALAEDIGDGDITSEVCVDASRRGQARLEARAPLVVCGLDVARSVFHEVDPNLEFEVEEGMADGVQVESGQPLARVRGSYRAILTAERTALNFLGRMCGIANQSSTLTAAVADLDVALVDTRKTTPGWRALEKYAVAVGGGVNHRVGLYDAVLIKDNHIAAAGGLEAAVRGALAGAPDGMPVQVEVESPAMADEAIALGARFLLLDNMDPSTIREIVRRHAPGILLEASGGISPKNLRAYAETGVARISMGALTHSVTSADLALEVDLVPTSESGIAAKAATPAGGLSTR